jgi:hypothetical protein
MAVITQELARQDVGGVDVVNSQMSKLKGLVRSSLKAGLDYGVIPGTGKKPTLLQPGAEKIALMLGITLRHDVTTSQLPGDHREVTVVSHAILRRTGEEVGDGIGLCSTMETKYRYRKDWDHKVNGRPGVIENRDVADVYNTVLKMAEKRADIDCVKRVAGASEFFTQDLEDMPDYEVQAPPAPPTTPAVDVQPIRDRFKQWCAATGHGPKDGMGAILAQVGAISMQELTQAQVAQAVALMDEQTAPRPAQEPTETPQAPDEPVEPDTYDEDQEF